MGLPSQWTPYGCRYDLNAQTDEGLGAIFQSAQLADATLVVKLKRAYGQGNEALQHGHEVYIYLCAAPQLGPCASAGRAWRLWAARHSQG